MPLPGDGYSLARAYEGKTFGAYRIARAIATGGMATVFLARRTGPGRFAQTAALKVIHPHLAREKEFVDMFLEEARIASSINHPNVCRVLDFGQAEGTFYLAMEYVRGETWATALERLTSQRESRMRMHALSTYVIQQACEGLHAVHEAVDPNGIPLQIVHRDISPQNLFIAYDGSVRVLDFGIATGAGGSVQGAGGQSTTQVIKGRYAYMAPEQARGAEVDRRADIWSLGVCLREALGGERLFERDTQVATILAVTKEELPAWPRQVPLLLREVCDRALERDPELRFQTARELGSALARFSASEAEPAGGAEVGRWMRTLFPEQIAQKRAELRELAGEDTNTGSFTSIMPLSGTTRSAAFEAQPTPATGSPRLRRMRRQVGSWASAAALAVGAAYVAFRLTPQLMHSQASPAPTAVNAEVRPGSSAGIPEVPLAKPALAQAPGIEPPIAVAPGVQVTVTSDIVAVAPGADEPTTPEASPADLQAAQVAPSAASDSVLAAFAKSDSPSDEEGHHHHRHHRHRKEGTGEGTPSQTGAPASDTKNAPTTATIATPTKSSESAAPGTLLVAAASGWAEVSLNGKALGTTPFRVELPAGSHRLEVRFFGTGSPQPMGVEIQPGSVTKLRLTQ
ncbi:MAG: protein kinase [Myxococcales bacterium]